MDRMTSGIGFGVSGGRPQARVSDSLRALQAFSYGIGSHVVASHLQHYVDLASQVESTVVPVSRPPRDSVNNTIRRQTWYDYANQRQFEEECCFGNGTDELVPLAEADETLESVEQRLENEIAQLDDSSQDQQPNNNEGLTDNDIFGEPAPEWNIEENYNTPVDVDRNESECLDISSHFSTHSVAFGQSALTPPVFNYFQEQHTKPNYLRSAMAVSVSQEKRTNALALKSKKRAIKRLHHKDLLK